MPDDTPNTKHYIILYKSRLDDCIRETTPEQRAQWAAFYADAYRWCAGLASETFPNLDIEVGAHRVADCVAALSPLKPWDQNLRLAKQACEWYATGSGGLPDIGAMILRRGAAAAALAGDGPGTGPKVAAFAYNIRTAGEGRVRATIDRHMLAMIAAPNATPRTVRVAETALIAATPYGYTPAQFQAVLWGWWRETKGYQTYDF